MRKPIEVWQLVVAIVALSVTAGSIIVKQTDRIQIQQDQIYSLQEYKADTKEQLNDIRLGQKETNIVLNSILVELQNKQDRPK